jgi:hypothetical protein
MRLAITFLATFVWIAVGNAITHGVLGAKLMARALSVLGSAARPSGGFPAWLLVVWLLIAATTTWLAIETKRPVVAGAVVGVLVDGGWNLVNRAVVPSWPLDFTAIDIAWHALHGATAGWLAARLWRRLTPRAGAPGVVKT